MTTLVVCFLCLNAFLATPVMAGEPSTDPATKPSPSDADAWVLHKLGKDGDSRGLELTLSLEQNEYVPGERINYKVAFKNVGDKAILLDSPSYKDQVGHLMLFLWNGKQWCSRNPGAHVPDQREETSLAPGKSIVIEGTIQSDVEFVGYECADINNMKLPAISCELVVRYKDQFSPEKEVAKSNKATFSVKPRDMEEVRAAYYVRQSAGPDGTGDVHVRRHYRLFAADKTNDLFFVASGFGTKRLGTTVDRSRICMLIGANEDVHILFMVGEKEYVHAIFGKGLLNDFRSERVAAGLAKLVESVKGEIAVAVQDG